MTNRVPFDVDIAVPAGRTMRVAVALPTADDGSAPGVVVIHEGFGLNDDIRSIAARFADKGYAAVAPDLYSAGSRLVCLVRTMVDITRFGRGEQTAALLDAAREELARYPVTTQPGPLSSASAWVVVSRWRTDCEAACEPVP